MAKPLGCVEPVSNGLRACYRRQALLVTEFGFEANRDAPVQERGTDQFQSNSVV